MLRASFDKSILDQDDKWLSLSRASKILGVNEATLRNWADAGEIRTFRTPGGHRRFAADDLQALIESRSGRQGDASAHGLGQLALDRIRRKLRHVHGNNETWMNQFDEQGKARARELGRRLVTVISGFIDKGRGKSHALTEIRRIGREYGIEMARCGIPLNEAVGAFVFFHGSMIGLAKEASKTREAPDHGLDTWRNIGQLLDALLLAITESYSQTQKSLDNQPETSPVTDVSYI